jgi:nucleoside-diphosphate-sugar epimerase
MDEEFEYKGYKALSTVLVTGITGYVGKALSLHLRSAGWQIRGAVRREPSPGHPAVSADLDVVTIPAINADTDWTAALTGIDAVIHLAARTHVLHENHNNPLEIYRLINVEGTAHLARSAAKARVKRFIYLSSVKVNGEGREEPYSERDDPAPEDAYGISKWEAEQILHSISAETGMEVVILRPPLVYGPGVKANFLRLLWAVHTGIPLPLSRIDNKRSLIYIDNLTDAIVKCLSHGAAKGKTYLVSDGEDISTPELVRRIAAALGSNAHLIPLPKQVLQFFGKITGTEKALARLIGSLTINMKNIRTELGWVPPYSLDQGLRATARWYKQLKTR